MKTFDKKIIEIEKGIDWDDYEDELTTSIITAKCTGVMMKVLFEEFKKLGIPEDKILDYLKENKK